MLIKNWKLLLNTNKTDVVFILDHHDFEVYKKVIKSQEYLINEGFSLIIPTIEEIKNEESSYFLKHYASKFKESIEDIKDNIIFIHSRVLDILIKREKRNNFFKFLLKNKKKIVIISQESIEEYIVSLDSGQQYNSFSIEDLSSSEKNIDIFKTIKIEVKKAYNPFKNPKFAYNKYLEEKD